MGKRFMNVENVAFTPVAGIAVPIAHVTNWEYDPQAAFIEGSGDAAAGPTSVNMTHQNPRATFSTEDIGQLSLIPPGTRGAMSWKAKNESQTGVGDMTYTLANAIIDGGRRSGRHRAYAEGQFTVRTLWPDGSTHPLSIAIST